MATVLTDNVLSPSASRAPMAATGVPKNKVVAATGGAAVGSSIAIIVTWFVESGFAHLQIQVPQTVLEAITVLVTTIATFAAGYMVPPGANEGSIVTQDGSVKSAVRQTV